VYFEYAPSSQGLGTGQSFRTPRRTIPANTPGPGRPDVEFHVAVKALRPSTSYDFRVCGRDENDPNRSTYDCAATRSFTTTAGSPEVSFLRRPAFPITLDTKFEAADFNRDGKLDVVTATADGPAVRLGDGTGGFGSATQVPSFRGEQVFAVGDLNGDDKPDLITRYGAPSTIIVRLGNGTGGFSGVSSSVSLDYPPASPVLRDFDRDGDLDLALVVVSGSGFSTRTFPRLLANDGAGHLSLRTPPDFGPGMPLPLAAADVNSDGKLDLVAAVFQAPNDSDARLATGLGNGDLTFAAPVTSASGGPADDLVLGDYNRDARADAATGGGALTGDGKGGFGNRQNFPLGRLAPMQRADFNGDGIADLVAYVNSSGPVDVLLGEGDGTFRTPNEFAGAPRLVGDFNGDGKPDILVVDDGFDEASLLLNTTP
jgi:hypothetical protein